MRTAVLTLALALSLAFCATASAAELKADFHFNGTKTAPTGHTMADLGEGNLFAAEAVDGATVPRPVLSFPAGNGLSLLTGGLAGSGSFSIVALFRMESLTTGRRKLLDFSSGSSDAGLYLCDGRLLIELLAGSSCPEGTAAENGWAQVAFTRSGETGQVSAYLGTDQASAVDALDATALGSEVRFFRDDEVAPADEHSGGAVARIRVYDGVLSEAEVGALDRVDGSPPAVSLNSVPPMAADATPTFSGETGTEAGDFGQVEVKVYDGATASGTPIRTLMANRSGSGWSADTPTALPDGTYTARAEQADGAGNTGLSESRTFTVDTVEPGVSLDALPGQTNDSTPTYGGTAGDAAGDAATVTVKVYDGSTAAGAPVQTMEATRSGATWSAAGSNELSDGTYTARAEQADEAGNIGLSASRTFTVDTQAASVSLTAPDAGVTRDRTPTYAGAAGIEPGDGVTVAVKVYSGSVAGGSPVQTLEATRSGASWSKEGTEPLADGTYTARAEQADGAGNTGLSAPRTFTVDGAGPAVTLDAPGPGSATNDSTPTYSGAAGDAPGDLSDVTVHLYTGAGVGATPVQTLTAARTGPTWSIAGSAPLPDGTYTAQARQFDSAGNANVSGPSTFEVDTARPETSITSSPADPTNDSTPEFAFTSPDGDGFVCRLYPADGASAPAFNGCSSPQTAGPLPDGSYIFQVAAVDAAGNQDETPGSRTFRVDSAPPRAKIVVAPGDTTATDAAFVFSADEAVSFRCRLDGGDWEPCGSPQSYSGLALGPHLFEVAASDTAGNEGSPTSHAWQVLRPGARIPAAALQAVTLAEGVVALRRALKRVPLPRAARRGAITVGGVETITAGTISLVVRARGGKFALAEREVPAAGSYTLKLELTRRARALARRVNRLRVDMTLAFTDTVGRALRANASTIMTRTGRARR